MIKFRTFRNGDPPALSELWNSGFQSLPAGRVARPLSPHEFDQEVMGKFHFDPAGLIVAEEGREIVGYAHGGFGIDKVDDPIHRLSLVMGTIGMLLVRPEIDDPGEIVDGLIHCCEKYLLDRGAAVLYAGGRQPLNPYYWGIYGGSEWSGVLGSDRRMREFIAGAGYEPVAESTLLEVDLTRFVEPRDPKLAMLRRRTRITINDDPAPGYAWDEIAIGSFYPVRFALMSKTDERVMARAMTWDMDWFSRDDDRPRLGIVEMYVEPEQRRQGMARLLLGEILQTARGQGIEIVAVQTGATNLPAIGLYKSLGFEPVDTATLYRLPAELTNRSRNDSRICR